MSDIARAPGLRDIPVDLSLTMIRHSYLHGLLERLHEPWVRGRPVAYTRRVRELWPGPKPRWRGRPRR